MAACAPVESRQNAALPTANVSSPRDGGNNIQSDATSQPAGFASHNLSGSNSTGTEPMSTSIGTGTGTGDLRQRTTDLHPPVSQSVSQSERSGTLPQKHARAKVRYSTYVSQHPLHVDTSVTVLTLIINDSRLSECHTLSSNMNHSHELVGLSFRRV